jgi:CRISPR/Cas system CSM-associated protein Csm3 (group 7 of RAMP superfamily)
MRDENPRYYKSVRLARKITGDVDAAHGHQQYTHTLLTGEIRGDFTALQPLHVGTGLYTPPAQLGIDSDVPLVKSFHQAQGVLTVPGSSLKGPIRSLVEAITYSCVNKTRNFWGRHERDDYGECTYRSQRHEGELCVACRMFGAMGFEGQIRFADAPQTAGAVGLHFIPAQYQPRGEKERRHYPHALQDPRDPQWPLQIASPGSVFEFHVQFQNLEAGQLGLLLLALGQGAPPICLKIGAGKNSGLGAVRFRVLQAARINVEKLYLTYDSSAAQGVIDIPACLQAAQNFLRRDDALGRLQADLGCDHFD